MTHEILVINYDSYPAYVSPFLKNLGNYFDRLFLTVITLKDGSRELEKIFSTHSLEHQIISLEKGSLNDIFLIFKKFRYRKFEYGFILDDSVSSRLLSYIFSCKKRISFEKNPLIDLMMDIKVERDDSEFFCDQYNFMLQKLHIRTPFRNTLRRSEDITSEGGLHKADRIGDVLFLCSHFAAVADLVKKISIGTQRRVICIETDGKMTGIFFRTIEKGIVCENRSLDKCQLKSLLSLADVVITPETDLYSHFSLFDQKTVLIADRAVARKYLFRSLCHYHFTSDEINRIINVIGCKNSGERRFFDFRSDDIPDFKNILVLKTGGLGDLVLSYPTVSLIRQAWPDAKITGLIIPYMMQLAKYNNDFDDIIAYDKQKKKDLKYVFDLGSKLRKRNFDAFFLLNRSPRVILLAALSRIKTVAGYGSAVFAPFITHRIFEKNRRKYKVLLQNLDIVRGLGLDVDDFRYGEYRVEECERIKKFIDYNRNGKEIILVNIGGRWPSKKFKPSKWSALINAMSVKYQKPVFLLWGPDERGIVDEVYKGIRENSDAFILPSTNMGEVAYAIGRAKIFITCDTGAMHIADAMKVPQIVLMGPTSPVRWGPVSPGSRIIYKKVPCGPCNTEVCKEHGNICMAQIKPQDILLEINKMGLGW